MLWVRVYLDARLLLVGVAYIPPKAVAATYRSFTEEVAEILTNPDDDAVLFSDLHLAEVSWREQQAHPGVFVPAGDSSHTSTTTLRKLQQLNLGQVINTTNAYGNVLDLVFARRPENVKVECPTDELCRGFGASLSHCAVKAEIKSDQQPRRHN